MSRSTRRGLGLRGVVVLAVIAASVVGWLYVRRAETESGRLAGTSRPQILQLIPEGALLVVVVDVAALRRTPLGARLLGQGRDIAGLGEVGELCGRDPMDAVEQLAVAVPDAARDTGFGLFATGRFDAELMLSCAESIVSRRGGRPVRQPVGSFGVLRDASLQLSSAELAVAEGGPVVLAEPAYVRASLELAEGTGKSLAADPAHALLRRLVDPGVVTATVVLSAEQRRTLVSELSAQKMPDSPFRAVTSGALSTQVDGLLQVHAVLRCEDEQACSAVAQLIDNARREEAKSKVAQAVGLTPVLEQLSVKAVADAVHLRARLPLEEALSLFRRMRALRRLGSLTPSSPPSGSTQPPPSAGPTTIQPDAGVRIEARPETSAADPTKKP